MYEVLKLKLSDFCKLSSSLDLPQWLVV